MRLYTTPRFAPLPDTQRINWPNVADQLHARPGDKWFRGERGTVAAA